MALARNSEPRSSSQARRRRVLTTVLGLASGCRHFDACPQRICDGDHASLEDARVPVAEDLDASNCGETQRDCDRSSGNGCETDLLRDVEHCGGCDKGCEHGICNSGHCVPFEVIATDCQTPRANIAFNADYAFFAASDTPGNARLYRVKLSNHAAFSVELPWSSVWRLAATSTRLYAVADKLYSLPMSLTEISEEQHEVTWVAASRQRLGYIADGHVYLRDADQGEDRELPDVENASLIEFDEDSVWFSTLSVTDGSRPYYELYSVTPPSVEVILVAQGAGDVVAIERKARSADPLYYLVRSAELTTALYGVLPEGEPTLLLDSLDEKNFALQRDLPFFGIAALQGVKEGRNHGLRMTPLGNVNATLEWQLAGSAEGLTTGVEADSLWFFDGFERALVSTRLNEVLAMGQ